MHTSKGGNISGLHRVGWSVLRINTFRSLTVVRSMMPLLSWLCNDVCHCFFYVVELQEMEDLHVMFVYRSLSINAMVHTTMFHQHFD